MGSLVAALASFLDAKVHHGQWLVRIEDVDEARSVPGAAEQILADLQTLGLHWDGEVLWQSRRKALYESAASQLGTLCYPCACSRREIADSRLGLASDGAAIYPGTCRHGVAPGRSARALRLRVPEAGLAQIDFFERRLGHLKQNLAHEVGDFVLRRADGFWSYQIAVVVDDAAQQISEIVRGEDLLDSTARQIYLQRLLGYSQPGYLHVPVVRNALGEKLSKQTGALALDLSDPLAALQQAARHLFDAGQSGSAWPACASIGQFWPLALNAWQGQLDQGWQRIGQAT
jgi:glutamyl-Q tRNA(Asp) synthetase